MNIGYVLKLARTISGIEQGFLAGELRVSCSYISQIEKGKKKPSNAFLRKYADFFKIPLPLLQIDNQSSADYDDVTPKLQKILSDLLVVRMLEQDSNTASTEQ